MKTIPLTENKLILDEIQNASSILMHCHPKADGDSLGSVLAMYHALQPLNKKITLIQGDTPLPDYLSFLPGYEIVQKKNFFELDLSQFDLFLILDSGSLNQISKVAPIVFPSHLKTVVIDHHLSNVGFADINLIVSTYPAACQIVWELLKSWNLPISKEAAICLFIGMYTDTGGFKFEGVSEKTFLAAADLIQIVPEINRYIFAMENNSTKDRLIVQKLFLNSIESWFSDSVAVASCSYSDMVKEGIDPGEASGSEMSNYLKSVVGWNIGISCIEYTPGKIRLSLRTRDSDTYDLTKISLALNGGGHKAAAGAVIEAPLHDAHEILKNALLKNLPFPVNEIGYQAIFFVFFKFSDSILFIT